MVFVTRSSPHPEDPQPRHHLHEAQDAARDHGVNGLMPDTMIACRNWRLRLPLCLCVLVSLSISAYNLINNLLHDYTLYVHPSMYVYKYVCMYVHMYVYVCVCGAQMSNCV